MLIGIVGPTLRTRLCRKIRYTYIFYLVIYGYRIFHKHACAKGVCEKYAAGYGMYL